MKKLTIVALVACVAMFAVSCKNQPKEAVAEEPVAVEEVATEPVADTTAAAEPAAETAEAAAETPAAEEVK